MRFVPRFSIRELICLAALLATGLGWWFDHQTLPKSDKDTPFLVLYPVKQADPNAVLTTLKKVFPGNPDLKLISAKIPSKIPFEAETPCILAFAPEHRQDEIRYVVTALERIQFPYRPDYSWSSPVVNDGDETVLAEKLKQR